MLARGLISLVGRGHIQVYEAVRAEKRTEYVAIFAGDFFIINMPDGHQRGGNKTKGAPRALI